MNKQDELVSIITPSYNTANYIEETINSVLAQTYSNWEMIVVDDCSDDNTDSIIVKFTDPRIKYIKNYKNFGAAICRNKALKEAKGKWIAFLDSDDIWEPQKLERQIEFMKKEICYFSYTEYSEIDENSRELCVIVSGPSRIKTSGMYNYCWPGCLTVMYDASVVGLIQISDIRKNNDYAMWLQVIKKADCCLLKEVLGHYRIRTGSISRKSAIKKIQWHYLMYRVCDNKSIATSVALTARNLIFGLYKKIFFVKKVKGF